MMIDCAPATLLPLRPKALLRLTLGVIGQLATPGTRQPRDGIPDR